MPLKIYPFTKTILFQQTSGKNILARKQNIDGRHHTVTHL